MGRQNDVIRVITDFAGVLPFIACWQFSIYFRCCQEKRLDPELNTKFLSDSFDELLAASKP